MDILELWPVVLCVTMTCAYFILGVCLISLHEFPRKEFDREHREVEDFSAKVTEEPQVLRKETWQAWAGALHPGWLLGLRVFSFLYLLGLLITVRVRRGSWLNVFYFYTEWTLGILIVYFGWGTFVSSVEYKENLLKHQETNVDSENGDLQAGLLGRHRPQNEKAGYLGYTLQILFQTAAPAVVLTDGVYWTFLYPFFPENFPHTFSGFNLHALNAVFLVAELFLNSMRFPWFRAAYFFVWSCTYVFFQWSIRAFGITNTWPYPFMDVSSTYAPICFLEVRSILLELQLPWLAQMPRWYLTIGILHVSAYAIIAFLNRVKLVLQSSDAHMSFTARWWSLAKSLLPGRTA